MSTDQALISKCQLGDRDAFAPLVSKYQNLVCSVAYASTGNLNGSEDLAQEAFVTAWQSIRELRDPSKFRSWLCGITRNLANNAYRRRHQDILQQADDITGRHVEAPNVDPALVSIAHEEADLIDRTLVTLPENVREPLVLYYREHHSVARVAELLDLTPDTVKQRLSRGRKLLRREIANLVERGLKQTAPGRAFTIGVMAALPVLTSTAKATAMTITAAKGASAMNATSWSGMIGTIVGPIIGVMGAWFGYRMGLNSARSERERQFIRRIARTILALIGVTMLMLALFVYAARYLAQNHATVLVVGILAVSLTYAVALMGLILYGNRTIVRIRQQDGTLDLPANEYDRQLPAVVRHLRRPRSYASRQRLGGIPLISVRYHGDGVALESRRPAIGWIAFGDRAYGILYASGNVAIGTVAVGAFALGPIAIGALAIGGLAMGGGAIGVWAIGGIAMAWLAYAGVAVAWKAASGGVAVAHQFALGGVAHASEANTAAAKEMITGNAFFRFGELMVTPWSWWLLILVTLAPLLLSIRLVRPGDASPPLHGEENYPQ